MPSDEKLISETLANFVQDYYSSVLWKDVEKVYADMQREGQLLEDDSGKIEFLINGKNIHLAHFTLLLVKKEKLGSWLLFLFNLSEAKEMLKNTISFLELAGVKSEIPKEVAEWLAG